MVQKSIQVLFNLQNFRIQLSDFRTPQLQWYREAENIPGVSGWVFGREASQVPGSVVSGEISLTKPGVNGQS
jgi:hypothetical protein